MLVKDLKQGDKLYNIWTHTKVTSILYSYAIYEVLSNSKGFLHLLVIVSDWFGGGDSLFIEIPENVNLDKIYLAPKPRFKDYYTTNDLEFEKLLREYENKRTETE